MHHSLGGKAETKRGPQSFVPIFDSKDFFLPLNRVPLKVCFALFELFLFPRASCILVTLIVVVVAVATSKSEMVCVYWSVLNLRADECNKEIQAQDEEIGQYMSQRNDQPI